ncbi:MAG TPA: radical SAM protein, partial [Isosphaeraceae bacterium]|nr:radical SAM protein [Isosphaeraceae bacterium]
MSTSLESPSRQERAALPLWVWPRAAYVHVPFCAHKCGYCDFASVAGADNLADRYVAALERELAFLEEPQEVDTIFVGGGTPTQLNSGQLERLLSAIRRWLPLAAGGEWTVEANPGTLDERKVDVLLAGGVNRVSLGAQSFEPALLRMLERLHGPEEVGRAVDLVRPRFERWSLDLIFGVPGSTAAQW